MKDIDYRDLYYSLYSDELDEDYKELTQYKPIFDGIRDYVYLYDHLSTRSGRDRYKASDKYMKELLKLCNRTPIEVINKVDDDVLETIDFYKAPYDLKSINELSTLLIPNYMANNKYKTYYNCFQNIFDYDYGAVGRDSKNREHTVNINNFRHMVLYAYDNMQEGCFYLKYQPFFMLFFTYFYANNYSSEKIDEIMGKIISNFDYYFDLTIMNIKVINNNVYKYIESIIKDLDCNKKLIK